MSAAQYAKISDFCETGSGTTPSRQKAERYYGGAIPWVKSGELREGEITTTEESVTEAALKETSLKIVPAGALLVAMYGATVGRVGRLAIEATTNQAVCHIVPNPSLADERYMFHALCAKASELVAKGVGGAQPNISQGTIKDTTVYLPPLDEQKRIAAILDQADELRRKRQRAFDRLSQLGQAIFHEMFGDFDGGGVPVARLGALTSKIGSGATPKGGDSAYKTEGTPLIRSMNVRDGEFSGKGLAFLDDRQAAKLNNVIVQANDVLLNITGASVARVCLAPPQMDGARVNQHVSIIRLSKSITSEFLEAFLLMPRTKRKLLTIAEAGATRQAITKAQIEELEVPVPQQSRQREFIERLRLARQSTVAMTSQSTELEAMFASLQHRAFKGEL